MIQIPLSRNLWTIMKEFNVLPTDPRFQNLTDYQVDWIMKNMEHDVEIQKLIAKGGDPNSFYRDAGDSWLDKPIDEFDPTEGIQISEEEIQRQMDELTDDETEEKLANKRRESEAWSAYLEDEGNERKDMTTEGIVQQNLQKALEESRILQGKGKSKWGQSIMSPQEEEASKDFKPMTQEGIEEAYKLFLGEEEEEESEPQYGPDDGWI